MERALGRASMNYRVFVLLGAMAAFGALWSSDGRYQAEQGVLARAERARSSNAPAIVWGGRQNQAAAKTGVAQPPAVPNVDRQGLEGSALLAVPDTRATRRDDVTVPEALLGRLVVAWVLNFDPGNGLSVLIDHGSLAKSRFEERYCLLRFRAREATYFASRRAAAFLRAYTSTPPQHGRFARIFIREIPIEETQAPSAGDRQTR
jgi:hypothetical protein